MLSMEHRERSLGNVLGIYTLSRDYLDFNHDDRSIIHGIKRYLLNANVINRYMRTCICNNISIIINGITSIMHINADMHVLVHVGFKANIT